VAAAPPRLIAALACGVGSLLLSGLYLRTELGDGRTLADSPAAAAIPAEVAALAGGTAAAPPRRLAPAERAALLAALRHAPLEQRRFDRFYAQRSLDVTVTDPRLDGAAALLARLGWRDTASSQNLLLRTALTGAYGAMIDRADSLLRRRHLTEPTLALMAALEVVPAMRTALIARLAEPAPWRTEFLRALPPRPSPTVLAARLDTLNRLQARERRLDRAEVVPLVAALAAAGRAEVAWRLWSRLQPLGGANLLHDADFRAAAVLSRGDQPAAPFDWGLGNGASFSVATGARGDRGLAIQWDGGGLPTFLTQQVRVPGPGRYRLDLATGQPRDAVAMLQPVLQCDARAIGFAPVVAPRLAAWVSDPVPADCAFPVLRLDARLTEAGRPKSVDVDRLVLQRLRG
jgi:DNA-binding HxlR family transcriptional regulator